MVVTHEQLLKEIKYIPETGEFFWRTSLTGRKLDQQAGCIDGSRSCSYRRIGISGTSYYAHRLAVFYMTGTWPEEVDHIDGNGLNNAWSNLRVVEHTENAKNKTINKNNTSGVCGVSFNKLKETWQAYIMINYKKVNLGNFKDWFAAVCARKSAEVSHNFHANHGRPNNDE